MDAPREEELELHRRLVWLTLFRLAVVLVLFVASFIWASGASVPAALETKLVGVCGAGFCATLAFALLLRRKWALTGIAYAQITFDAFLAAALVYLTGGSNTFAFLFVLAVVNAALVLSQRGAIFAASLSTVLYAVLRVGLNEGWLLAAAAFLKAPHAPETDVLFNIFVNMGAVFLMAALASYLADQLRKKGEQLSARELDYTALAELHRATLASIGSGMATADEAGKLLFVNRAGWEICAPWQSAREGVTVAELFPGFDLGAASRAVVRQEIEVAGRGGDRHWLGLTVSALSGGGQFSGGHVIVFQDLTELRRLELDARRNERLAALGQLAAGLAHELRNPLASMSGAVQMLAGQGTADADQRRLGEIVAGESERLNRLVTDFLAFARPTSSRPAPLDLSELVGETLDVVAHGPGREALVIERHLEPVPLVGDGNQLRQVVWNLVVNAVEAMASEGKLTVSVARTGEWAVLTLDDSGPGIGADALSKLFDPFFTTKAAGTGLGLATVHALVDAHRGTVAAENLEGGGARFTVKLPAPRASALAPNLEVAS